MQWNDSLSVGDVQIDRQHQHLFNLLNAMEERFAGYTSKSFTNVIIGELRRYVEKHLRDEEWVLKSIKYVDYESHCAMHRVFEETLDRLTGQLESGPPEATIKEVKEFGLHWLRNQGSSVDMQYKPHLKG